MTNNADTISVGFIDRTLKKRVDQALLPMINGTSVIVTGDKPTVRIVTNTLRLFGQHIAMDVIEWLDEVSTIARNLTGMSENKFRNIKDELKHDYVHIDIDKGKINNGKSNKYISNWFKDVKKFDLDEGNKYIVRTLNGLVSSALGITRLTALPKNEAVDELLKLKKSINDKDKFAIVSDLASQRNPLLESMIEDISSAIKSAEDYFSNF